MKWQYYDSTEKSKFSKRNKTNNNMFSRNKIKCISRELYVTSNTLILANKGQVS